MATAPSAAWGTEMRSSETAASTPQLASAGILVRPGGEIMLLRHAAGPFAGRWSLPIVGVAADETAEDALARLLREILHVEPGPFAFLDTIPLEGARGERFVVNAFSCVDWSGSPALSRGLYDDAAWVPPAEAAAAEAGLDLVPELRLWLEAQIVDRPGGLDDRPGEDGAAYDAALLLGALSDARGALLAAFDAIPAPVRNARIDGDVSSLDQIALAADLEVYAVAEAGRVIAEPGRAWREFNEAQWADLRATRLAEAEPYVRARLEAARETTRAWLATAGDAAVNAYADAADGSVVQIGERLDAIAYRDRMATAALLRMALAGAVRPGGQGGR